MANETIHTKDFDGKVEYEMSAKLAKEILAARKSDDRNMHPQQYLCKVVNEEFGIKGNVVRVLTV